MSQVATAEVVASLTGELERSFQAHEQPVFARESINLWVLACEQFLARGQIAAAEHAVRNLHVQYPQLRYAETMTAVFDRCPCRKLRN